MNIPAWFVLLMGFSTVFIGLVVILGICKLLSLLFCERFISQFKSLVKKYFPNAYENEQNNSKIAKNSADTDEKNSIICAISAAIAAENGAEAKTIKILSIKKI